MADQTVDIKSLVRKKSERNGVQKLRFYAQLFSAAISVWIGIQFYLWVKFIQNGGRGWAVPRPAGAEGYLPIGSLVSLRYLWHTGIINDIHPAGLVILATILLVSFIFQKAFCSWVCPIGFISEILGDMSDKIFRRRLLPPKWLDWPLRMLKYVLLAFFAYAVFIKMTPESIKAFLYSDYNVISDILMLRFFTDISSLALGVIGFIFLMSLIVRGFWCRYLCPYGGLLGLIGLISPTKIKRNARTCIDCSACTRVCPAFIKVEAKKTVLSDECSSCMACVDSCPIKNTLVIKGTRRKSYSTRQWAAAVLILFWGLLLAAKVWGPWDNKITTDQYIKYMPGIESGQYIHPR